MNRSDLLTSASDTHREDAKQSPDTNGDVEDLVSIASDPTAMAASEAFLDLWQKVESEVIEAQAAGGSEALQPLHDLLNAMPVGHIDRASAFRVDAGLPLVELCAFRVVAASVAKNFPTALSVVVDARAALSAPTPEDRDKFTGSEIDLDQFFGWMEAGKPAEDVYKGPDYPHESPEVNSEMREWLEMMAKEHECDSQGRFSLVPLEDAGVDEPYEGEEMSQGDEDIPMVQTVFSSSDDAFSSSSTDVDECLDMWLLSDAAKKLLDFLEQALPRE